MRSAGLSEDRGEGHDGLHGLHNDPVTGERAGIHLHDLRIACKGTGEQPSGGRNAEDRNERVAEVCHLDLCRRIFMIECLLPCRSAAHEKIRCLAADIQIFIALLRIGRADRIDAVMLPLEIADIRLFTGRCLDDIVAAAVRICLKKTRHRERPRKLGAVELLTEPWFLQVELKERYHLAFIGAGEIEVAAAVRVRDHP